MIMKVLEIVGLLQLDDSRVTGVATKLLLDKLDDDPSLEEVFHIWNIAVIYDLADVLPALFRLIDAR